MTKRVTINFRDCKLDIKGEYYEEVPMLWNYSNGDPGHPGEPPSFEIENIYYNEKDVTALFDACNAYVNEQIGEFSCRGDLFIELENLCLKELN